MPVRVLFPASLPVVSSSSSPGSSISISVSVSSSSSSSPLVGAGQIIQNSSATNPPPLLDFASPSSSSPPGSVSSYVFHSAPSVPVSSADSLRSNANRKRQRNTISLSESESESESTTLDNAQLIANSDSSSTAVTSVLSSSVPLTASKSARRGPSPSATEISDGNSSSPDFFSLMPMRNRDEFHSYLLNQPSSASVSHSASLHPNQPHNQDKSASAANRRKRRHFEAESESTADPEVKSSVDESSSQPAHFASSCSLPSSSPPLPSRKRGSDYIESSSPDAKRMQPRHRITNIHLRALHEERVRRKSSQVPDAAMMQSPPAKAAAPASGTVSKSRFNLLSPAVQPRSTPFFSQVHLEDFDHSNSSWAGLQPQARSTDDTQMGFSMTPAAADHRDSDAQLDSQSQSESLAASDSQAADLSQSTLGPFSLSLRSNSRSLSNGSAMFD